MAATRRSKPAGRHEGVGQVTAAAGMARCAAARRSAAARPLPPPLPSRPATPPLLTRVPAALAVAQPHRPLHPLTIAAGGREGRRHTLTTHARHHAALYRHTTHTCRRAI